MKSAFLLLMMFPVMMHAQKKNFLKRRLNLSVYAGSYMPFLKSEFYVIDPKTPNTLPSPIGNPQTKQGMIDAYRFGFSLNSELSWNFHKRLYACFGLNYVSVYKYGRAFGTSILTYNGYWLDMYQWKAKEVQVFLSTGIECRLHPFVFIHLGFIHKVYNADRKEYITWEVSEKSGTQRHWRLNLFMGQYVEASTRIAKFRNLYFSLKLVHLNSAVFSFHKSDYAFTAGFRVFIF